jgi:hypothetical protein
MFRRDVSYNIELCSDNNYATAAFKYREPWLDEHFEKHCESDKASKTDIACFPSLSTPRPVGPVYNIPFRRIDGQGHPK